MPQVPNRYYNSPWIADAARNLSMALYGDPEREAARDRQDFEVQRMRDADALAAEDRVREQNLSDVYSRLAIAPQDQKAAIAQEAFRYRGKPSEVMSVWGTGSPQQLMQEDAFTKRVDAQFSQLEAKIAAAKEGSAERAALQRELGELRAWVTMRGQNMGAETADKNRAFRERVLSAKDDKGGKLFKVSSDDLDDMSYEIKKYLRTKPGGIAADLEQDVLLRASQYMNLEGNAGTSIAQAMVDLGIEDANLQAGQNNFWSGDVPAQLIPKNRRSREWILANPPRGGAATLVRNTASASPGAASRASVPSMPGSLGSAFDLVNGPTTLTGFGQPALPNPITAPANPNSMVKPLPTFTKLEDAYKALQTGDDYIDPDGVQRKWNREKYEAKYLKKGGR